MKKITWAIICAAIVWFIIWSKNPLDETMNFIIGGTIPGTKNSIGFWPMLGVVGLILIGVRKFFQNLKFQMLEHTAKQITKEKAIEEFEQTNSSDTIQFDRSKRSVIAAPSQSSII